MQSAREYDTITTMNYKSYIELEHIATKQQHTEPLNSKECQLLLIDTNVCSEMAFDSIADRMGIKWSEDEDCVFEDHLGNHYFIDRIVIDGQEHSTHLGVAS